MAYIKRQLRTLPFLVSAILLLCTANAIRSLATEKDDISREFGNLTEKATWQRFPKRGHKTLQHEDEGQEMNDLEENCNNVDEDEKCLMRRTVAAHVDYIYTQQHDP